MNWRHESISTRMRGKINTAMFHLSWNRSFSCRSSGSAPARCPDAGPGGGQGQYRATMRCWRQPSSKNRMEASGTQRHRESGGDTAVPTSRSPRLGHVHMWGPEHGGSQRAPLRTNRRQVWVPKLITLLRIIESNKITITSYRSKFRQFFSV
jgi:hypothetical protein